MNEMISKFIFHFHNSVNQKSPSIKMNKIKNASSKAGTALVTVIIQREVDLL